jgi:hypothetical protein
VLETFRKQNGVLKSRHQSIASLVIGVHGKSAQSVVVADLTLGSARLHKIADIMEILATAL